MGIVKKVDTAPAKAKAAPKTVEPPKPVAPPSPAVVAVEKRKRHHGERNDMKSVLHKAERESEVNFTERGHAINEDALNHALERLAQLITKLADADKKRTITVGIIERAAALLFQDDAIAQSIAAKATQVYQEYAAVKGEVKQAPVKKEIKTGPKRTKQ